MSHVYKGYNIHVYYNEAIKINIFLPNLIQVKESRTKCKSVYMCVWRSIQVKSTEPIGLNFVHRDDQRDIRIKHRHVPVLILNIVY